MFKKRPTLVIDECDDAIDKKTKKKVKGYVHRECTHSYHKNYEKLEVNPDKNDNQNMYLKRPSKIPRKLVKKLDQDFDMPDSLIKRYSKNNHNK